MPKSSPVPGNPTYERLRGGLPQAFIIARNERPFREVQIPLYIDAPEYPSHQQQRPEKGPREDSYTIPMSDFDEDIEDVGSDEDRNRGSWTFDMSGPR